MRQDALEERGRSGGFTLIEVVIAAALFAGIGYVLNLALRASDASHATVAATAELNASVRGSTTLLRDELRAARSASIQIEDLGAFDRLTFERAIANPGGGAPAWGAYDRDLDLDEALCHRPGWRVEYVADPALGPTPPLVRRILDDLGTVRHTRTLGDAVSEFRVARTGDLWVVTLTAVGDGATRREEFDVRTRDGQ